MWHTSTHRGSDIEMGQANAARAGWPELWGYWRGVQLHGHLYYRPLSSWLFVAEYRLFGRDDRLWSLVSLVGHLGVAVALTWTVTVLAAGSRLRRLGLGVLAALLFGAPFLADLSVQQWTLGWWPAQPDVFSLLFGLLLLGSAARYARTGQLRWAMAAPVWFWLTVCFKETGYLAGLGACLLLLRRPQARALLVWLAGCGLVLFAFRSWALGHTAGTVDGYRFSRAVRLLMQPLLPYMELSGMIGLHAVLLAAAALLAWCLRRHLGGRRSAATGGIAYLLTGTVLLGPPWESGWLLVWTSLIVGVSLLAMWRAARRWPVPELGVIYALCVLTTGGSGRSTAGIATGSPPSAQLSPPSPSPRSGSGCSGRHACPRVRRRCGRRPRAPQQARVPGNRESTPL